ncbi:MAG: Uma2 family endonuclease [Gemmataceae bacterium]
MSERGTTAGERTDHEWVFRYGYRLVKRQVRLGHWETVEVPLTRDQYLHPEEEDRFMCKPRHEFGASYVAGVLRSLLGGRPGMSVLLNTGVNFGRGIRGMRPDVSAFTGGRRPLDMNEGTFDVVEEGATPLLVLEITSTSTRDVDLTDKVGLYTLAEGKSVCTKRRGGEYGELKRPTE